MFSGQDSEEENEDVLEEEKEVEEEEGEEEYREDGEEITLVMETKMTTVEEDEENEMKTKD